jgi:hypothetical protein
MWWDHAQGLERDLRMLLLGQESTGIVRRAVPMNCGDG